MANAADGEENIPLGNPVQAADSVDATLAATAPSKKETSLREFLGKMDEYAPIVSIFCSVSPSIFFAFYFLIYHSALLSHDFNLQ